MLTFYSLQQVTTIITITFHSLLLLPISIYLLYLQLLKPAVLHREQKNITPIITATCISSFWILMMLEEIRMTQWPYGYKMI